MATITLRQFERNDIDLVNQWVTSDELAHMFAGPFVTRPISYEALVHDAADDEVAFIVEAEGQAIGTAQLRGIDPEARSCRIACVLLFDPTERGKGTGGRLIQTLVSYARERLASATVTLFVLKDNAQAIACYERCGFAFTGQTSPAIGGGLEMSRST